MEFKNVVFNAARDGKLRRLKIFLDHRPKEEVAKLVTARTNGATPLVLSCRNGHQEVVQYLVDRCEANVEQAGSVTFDGETIEGAPPLWCAAAADIEVANRHGHTCLMIACYKGHYKIARYLIDIGADVNRKSVKGNTALHDCAESGSLEIMKLLLTSGARIDVDAYGMTPLLAASVTGHLHIVEHLIGQKDLVGRQERIDALDLLGATFVDKKRDMLGALNLWKRAIEERYHEGVLILPKALVKSPISAYENTLEVESVEALEEIISDPDSMRMQALLVRERILGPAHPDTSYYIRYRGAVYADMGHFERCITLWMYALDMQQKILEPLSPMTQSSLLSFAELFSFMMSEGGRNSRGQVPFANLAGGGREVAESEGRANNNDGTPRSSMPPVSFCDIMTVFDRAVREVKAGQAALESGEAKSGDATYFNRTIVILLHLVCLFTKLIPHLQAEQVHNVKQAVYNFVKIGARGKGGATPLHLACTKESSAVGRYPICVFPSVPTIALLLECGAQPDALDHEGNSALHTAAGSKPAKQAVIQTLLSSGCHFDQVNHAKKGFYNILKGQPLHEVANCVKHTSLKCLAARVVNRHELHKDVELPPSLQQFISQHWPMSGPFTSHNGSTTRSIKY